MGNIKIKKMVQGAMLAAIFGALSIFNTYTGSLFDIFICYAMVIPLVWYSYHYSLHDSFIVAFVSMLVIMITGLPFFAISAFSSCLIGLFLGQALKHQASRGTLLIGTLFLTFINNILLYEVFAGLLGMDLIAEMKEMYIMMQDMIPSLSQSISMNSFLSLAPLLLLIMSILEMYVILLFCQMVLARLDISFPSSFHIAYMHINRTIGWIVLFLWILSYCLQNIFHFYSLYFTYIQLMSSLVFAVEGVAFLSWLLILYQKPRGIILIMIGFLIPIVLPGYIVVGIIDIFSDLRDKLLYNKHNGQGGVL